MGFFKEWRLLREHGAGRRALLRFLKRRIIGGLW